MNYYNNKKIHTITKNSFYCFNAVQDEKIEEKLFDLAKIEQRKQEKDFMKINNLKKETKSVVHQE